MENKDRTLTVSDMRAADAITNDCHDYDIIWASRAHVHTTPRVDITAGRMHVHRNHATCNAPRFDGKLVIRCMWLRPPALVICTSHVSGRDLSPDEETVKI